MAVIIRYITGWKEGDAFIADGQCGSGIWVHKARGIPALEFATEADAKSFLVKHKYDLPPLQVVFEQI